MMMIDPPLQHITMKEHAAIIDIQYIYLLSVVEIARR